MALTSSPQEYLNIRNKRKGYQYSFQENKFITTIKKNTAISNIDNISRTKAYASFYDRNAEIKWSFLASMVSRNAGWNMTDLEGKWFKLALSWQQRFPIFYSYELANWMIFNDAYPQLLLYELSTYYNKPLFYLLKEFNVSSFMEYEWERFWWERDEERLVKALIINEQNVIQNPVLENEKLKRTVFETFTYLIQDIGHFSCVIFPTQDGKLFGYSVHGFQKLTNRIELGKKLAALLFSGELYDSFYQFSKKTEHTGSRFDYERYLHPHLFRETPVLRSVFPVVDHQEQKKEDWVVKKGKKIDKWFRQTNYKKQEIDLTKWFIHKQHQLHSLIAIKKWL